MIRSKHKLTDELNYIKTTMLEVDIKKILPPLDISVCSSLPIQNLDQRSALYILNYPG